MGSLVVDWVPGSTRVLSSGYDGCARLWDLASGEMVSEMKMGRGMVELAAASPDGTHLAATCGKALKIWSQDGSLVMKSDWHPHSPTVMVWEGNGKYLATGTQGFFLTWNRKESLEKGLPEMATELSFGLTSLALDPNGRWAACGSSDNGLRLIALTEDSEDFAAGPYQHLLTTLCWSVDGRWLVTPNDTSLAVFDSSRVGKPDPETFQLIKSHNARINKVLFHPTLQDVFASGDREGTVIIHDAGTREVLSRFVAGKDPIGHLEWISDGRLLVADESGIVQLFTWSPIETGGKN